MLEMLMWMMKMMMMTMMEMMMMTLMVRMTAQGSCVDDGGSGRSSKGKNHE